MDEFMTLDATDQEEAKLQRRIGVQIGIKTVMGDEVMSELFKLRVGPLAAHYSAAPASNFLRIARETLPLLGSIVEAHVGNFPRANAALCSFRPTAAGEMIGLGEFGPRVDVITRKRAFF